MERAEKCIKGVFDQVFEDEDLDRLIAHQEPMCLNGGYHGLSDGLDIY